MAKKKKLTEQQLEDAEMKTFDFIIQLRGEGATQEEAWANAVLAFMEDPPLITETEVEEVEEEKLADYSGKRVRHMPEEDL